MASADGGGLVFAKQLLLSMLLPAAALQSATARKRSAKLKDQIYEVADAYLTEFKDSNFGWLIFKAVPNSSYPVYSDIIARWLYTCDLRVIIFLFCCRVFIAMPLTNSDFPLKFPLHRH
jgi:hypothetical protein